MKTEKGDEDSLWSYGCDQCEKVFEVGICLMGTFEGEYGLIMFKCDICGMAADSGIGLNRHIKAKHI